MGAGSSYKISFSATVFSDNPCMNWRPLKIGCPRLQPCQP